MRENGTQEAQKAQDHLVLLARLVFPLRVAWRETRAALGKFLFVVLSVALGAAALTAVTGFNESVRYTLLREARSLMAGDIAVRMPVEPSAREAQFLASLESKGIQTTRVTETVSMASSGQGTPTLISVKGADLAHYPFYGQLTFDPPSARLDAQSAAVSDDLLLRLGLRIGDDVTVGNARFKIVARITKEPDRMTTGFTLGPRVLFTREGLASAGIIVPGSRITEHLRERPVIDEIHRRQTFVRETFGVVCFPDHREPVRCRIRQRPQHDLVEQCEDRRDRADAGPKRKERANGKHRRAHEQPDAEPQILKQLIHGGLTVTLRRRRAPGWLT